VRSKWSTYFRTHTFRAVNHYAKPTTRQLKRKWAEALTSILTAMSFLFVGIIYSKLPTNTGLTNVHDRRNLLLLCDIPRIGLCHIESGIKSLNISIAYTDASVTCLLITSRFWRSYDSVPGVTNSLMIIPVSSIYACPTQVT